MKTRRIFADNATRLHERTKFSVSTSDTLVNFCQTTRRYNLQGSHFHTRRRENLKPYIMNDEYMYIISEPHSFKIYSVNVVINVINNLMSLKGGSLKTIISHILHFHMSNKSIMDYTLHETNTQNEYMTKNKFILCYYDTTSLCI
jgi:hypothetical protein